MEIIIVAGFFLLGVVVYSCFLYKKNVWCGGKVGYWPVKHI
jgi:hypothetical protein